MMLGTTTERGLQNGLTASWKNKRKTCERWVLLYFILNVSCNWMDECEEKKWLQLASKHRTDFFFFLSRRVKSFVDRITHYYDVHTSSWFTPRSWKPSSLSCVRFHFIYMHFIYSLNVLIYSISPVTYMSLKKIIWSCAFFRPGILSAIVHSGEKCFACIVVSMKDHSWNNIVAVQITDISNHQSGM